MYNPDRTDAVRYIQTFATARLGTLELEAGPAKLTVQAVEFAGETVAAARRIEFQHSIARLATGEEDGDAGDMAGKRTHVGMTAGKERLQRIPRA